MHTHRNHRIEAIMSVCSPFLSCCCDLGSDKRVFFSSLHIVNHLRKKNLIMCNSGKLHPLMTFYWSSLCRRPRHDSQAEHGAGLSVRSVNASSVSLSWQLRSRIPENTEHPSAALWTCDSLTHLLSGGSHWRVVVSLKHPNTEKMLDHLLG